MSEDLYNRQLDRSELFELGLAMQELAKGFNEHSAGATLRHVQNSGRCLDRFMNNLVPVPELTEDEAALSSNMHTYMRKYMDGALSVLLYNLISEGIGAKVWFTFVKEVMANKKCAARVMYQRAIMAARKIADDNPTTDNIQMSAVLRLWEEDFPTFVELLENGESAW